MENINTNEQELIDVLDIFASNQDRMLLDHKLGDVLRIMGRIPTEAELKELKEKYADDKHFISFENIKTIMKIPFKYEEDKDLKKWTSFLLNSGKISLQELRFVLTHFGECMDKSEIQPLFFSFFNNDPSGMIDQDTLVEYLQNLY